MKTGVPTGNHDLRLRVNAKVAILLVIAALGVMVIVQPVHADTSAYAIPSPAHCVVSGACLFPGQEAYLGAADVEPDTTTQGVGVVVSFTGTTASNIQSDNDLAAGVAAYAGCGAPCGYPNSVDYVYYGFVDLSNSGRVRFDSAWWLTCEWESCPSFASSTPEDCMTGEHGWNTCPDSYHFQLFHDSWTCSGCTVSRSILVQMQWSGSTLYWNYYLQCGTDFWCPEHSTSSTPPSSWPSGAIGAYLKTGTGQTTGFPEWYHFEFGISTLYPIGQSRWQVTLNDPEYMTGGTPSTAMTSCGSVNGNAPTWCLIGNAEVFDGYNSYFDNTYSLGGQVFGSGGVGYFNGVTVTSSASGCSTSLTFQYTGSTVQKDGQSLWSNVGPNCAPPDVQATTAGEFYIHSGPAGTQLTQGLDAEALTSTITVTINWGDGTNSSFGASWTDFGQCTYIANAGCYYYVIYAAHTYASGCSCAGSVFLVDTHDFMSPPYPMQMNIANKLSISLSTTQTGNYSFQFTVTASGGTPTFGATWNFGDGSTASCSPWTCNFVGTSLTISHTYVSGCICTVTVTVTDSGTPYYQTASAQTSVWPGGITGGGGGGGGGPPKPMTPADS